MKIVQITLLSVCLFSLFCACDREENGFNMTYQRTFEIQAGAQPSVVQIYTINNVATDTTLFFNANGVHGDGIISINPAQCRLFAQLNDIDFAFVDLVAITIVNPLNSDDRKEVFYRDNIPFNEDGVLDVFPDLPDVKDILMRLPKYNLEVVLRFREAPASAIPVRVDWSFRATI